MDLSQRDVDASMHAREAIKELLDACAAISKPGDGAPRVLIVFAQMAAGACDWLDGELRVELVETGDVTVIECMTDLGGGFRERVFAPITMRASIEEFRRATTVPEMIAPLVVKASKNNKLVLVAEPTVEFPSMVAPAVEIGKDNLFHPSQPLLRGAPRGAKAPGASGGPGSAAEPSVRSRSSASMRAAFSVAVPAAAPVPTFLGVEPETATVEIEGAPRPSADARGARDARAGRATTDALAHGRDRDHDRAPDDTDPPAFTPTATSATRTMIPSGLVAAPPPPPIVQCRHRDSSGKMRTSQVEIKEIVEIKEVKERAPRVDPRRDDDGAEPPREEFAIPLPRKPAR